MFQGKKKKRKRSKSEAQLEGVVLFPPLLLREDSPTYLCLCCPAAANQDPSSQPKRPRVPPPPEETPQPARPPLTQPHTVSHLTHTHLSQASPASSLDSPATPTMALASPAAPAPTHTELTLPYAEQLQPLSLTTKPHRTPLPPRTASTPVSDMPTSTRGSSPPLPSQPFLVPSSAHQSGASAQGALSQSQPLSLRRTNQLIK